MTPEACLKALEWRYATKQFDPSRKIDSRVWDVLMKTLVMAPTSFGMELWQFLDVRDESVREQLRTVSWDQGQVTDASHYVVIAVRRDVREEDCDRHIRRMCEVRGMTPDMLEPYKAKFNDFYSAKSSVEAVSWVDRQSYIALGFMMLAAAAFEIDTCAIEGMDPLEYDRILNLEGTPYRTICALALGYRDPSDKYATTPKVRYRFEDVVKVV